MNNSGTLVIAPIRPQDSADTYPVALANEIAGGWQAVISLSARDAIPEERRALGMLVYVLSNSTGYLLRNGLTNSDWEEAPFTVYVNLSAYLTLSGGQMSGRIWFAEETITYSTSAAIDFDRDNYQTLDILAGSPTVGIYTINRGKGKTVSIRIVNNSGVLATFNFPSAIRFLNSTKPEFLPSGKIGILTMTSYGFNETDTVAVYAAEQ